MKLLRRAKALLGDRDYADGPFELGLGEARLVQSHRVTSIEGMVYRPLVCLILQGAKDVQSGELSVKCPQGHAIVVSHDLPVLSRITQASTRAPYVAFILPLQLGMLRSFYEQIPELNDENSSDGALAAFQADLGLLDAISRFLNLVGEDRTAQLLAPILLREIHAKLLLSPHGAMLKRLVWRDNPSSHVASAIAAIRNSIRRPLSISALAENARMSKSSFHSHFKAVTGLSPGQYQKDIRLLEARRLIIESDLSISSVAFEVGYESPAQFSRDYNRKFGSPPREDRKNDLEQAQVAAGSRPEL